MGLRDIESTLPPGFRFYPSDEELVCHYLYKKVANERASGDTMVEVDLHSREPWELPEVAKLGSNEWYVFSFRGRKYATGSRMNRATKCGYWKATGKDRIVYEHTTDAVMGMRKTLVFYRGRAPNGTKTNWVMHEFRLQEAARLPAPKENWVLCRVSHKKKRKNPTSYSLENEQYGYLESSPPPPPPPLLHEDHPMADEFYEQETNASFPAMVAHDQEDNSMKTFLNLALWRCNLLGFAQELDSAMLME